MSKGFHMIGWRLGWVCGAERIVRAFADIKDNSDSGQFIAIQKAAAAALDDESIPRQVRQKYRRRYLARMRWGISGCRSASAAACCTAMNWPESLLSFTSA